MKILKTLIFLTKYYAHDTKFFVSDIDSVIEVVNAFDKFSLLSGLKPNKTKCEIASIGVLKRLVLALCSKDYTDLTKKTINYFGIHFSYNKKFESEENFIRRVGKIEKVLKF